MGVSRFYSIRKAGWKIFPSRFFIILSRFFSYYFMAVLSEGVGVGAGAGASVVVGVLLSGASVASCAFANAIAPSTSARDKIVFFITKK